MKLKSITGVLLAYHEEAVIKDTITKLSEELAKITEDWEIVVVGIQTCKDKTNEIVLQMANVDSRIKLVLQKPEERGYGRAFWLGLTAASKQWVFQSDADGQYDLSGISKLALCADENVALVHGYRSKRQDPLERKVFAFCYNMLLKLLFLIKIKDVDSAFKLIRKSAFSKLQLESKSGFCVAEMVIQFQRNKFKIVQIPAVHLPRLHGEALAEKGIENPFGIQLPNFSLTFGTLKEAFLYRFK